MITWGSIKHDCSFGADKFRIAKAWNELCAAGLAYGEISKGFKGRVLEREPGSDDA